MVLNSEIGKPKSRSQARIPARATWDFRGPKSKGIQKRKEKKKDKKEEKNWLIWVRLLIKGTFMFMFKGILCFTACCDIAVLLQGLIESRQQFYTGPSIVTL